MHVSAGASFRHCPHLGRQSQGSPFGSDGKVSVSSLHSKWWDFFVVYGGRFFQTKSEFLSNTYCTLTGKSSGNGSNSAAFKEISRHRFKGDQVLVLKGYRPDCEPCFESLPRISTPSVESMLDPALFFETCQNISKEIFLDFPSEIFQDFPSKLAYIRERSRLWQEVAEHFEKRTSRRVQKQLHAQRFGLFSSGSWRGAKR